MRIHLVVRCSTSAMFEKNPQIFTYCKFIQLVQIKDIVYLVKTREIRTKCKIQIMRLFPNPKNRIKYVQRFPG